MKSYLSIPNWEKFQHYKDRNPPWIKLHNELLENYEFECLQDASKAHLLCLWLLASRTGNKIKADPEWIKRKICANEPVDINMLVTSGFLLLNHEDTNDQDVCSGMLADSLQDACLEERRGEGEKSKEEREQKEPSGSNRLPPVPYQKIVDLYHEKTKLPRVEVLSESRKKHIRARWKEPLLNSLESWGNFFDYVGSNKFLNGDNDRSWVADFDFLIKANTAIKAQEGKYDERI